MEPNNIRTADPTIADKNSYHLDLSRMDQKWSPFIVSKKSDYDLKALILLCWYLTSDQRLSVRCETVRHQCRLVDPFGSLLNVHEKWSILIKNHTIRQILFAMRLKAHYSNTSCDCLKCFQQKRKCIGQTDRGRL